MKEALKEARKAFERDEVPVGAVIVCNNKIIARTHNLTETLTDVTAHAEMQAFTAASGFIGGKYLNDCTLYVTLEPCAHHGQTPPCAEALIDAGVARVVTAVQDPDPRTAGDGHRALRAAGIEVVTGVLEDEARRDHAGFLSRIERGRPYTILKLAVSKDGMLSAAPGKQTAITGKAANEHVHMMRAQADAIMIGAGTARVDDPSLTCRLEGYEDRSPIRVVIASDPGSLNTLSMLKTREQIPVWFLTLHDGPDHIVCAKTANAAVDLNDGMKMLAARGIGRLMVEGGAEISSGLLELDLIDEIVLITGPQNLGDGGVAAPLELISPDKFNETVTLVLGDDRLTTYVRAQ